MPRSSSPPVMATKLAKKSGALLANARNLRNSRGEKRKREEIKQGKQAQRQ